MITERVRLAPRDVGILRKVDGEASAGRYELTTGRSRLRPGVAVFAIALALSGVLFVTGDRRIAALGFVVFGFFLVLSVVTVLRPPKVVATLDRDGLAFRKGPTWPWSSVRALKVTRTRPRLLSSGWLMPMEVLVFVPHDLEETMALLSSGRRRLARPGAALYGSPLAVMQAVIEEPFDDVIAAAQRFAPLPVESDCRREPRRRWFPFGRRR
jgi:hypothetical protein